ncbi:MAG: DUF448 domain-containing protein [Bdellovibrionales bacterium]
MDARTEPTLIKTPSPPATMQGRPGDGEDLPKSSASLTPSQNKKNKAKKTSERKCLATGEMLPKSALLRFVIGPNHDLVVDLAEKLPGRGLWVKAERAALERALSKNLFSKAAHAQTRIPPKYLEQITALQRKRCLDLMGLAKGAGEAVLGETQVESAIRQGKIALLIIADDAAKSTIVELASQAQKTAENNGATCAFTVNKAFNRAELGQAFGYAQIVYAGIRRGKLSEIIISEQARLEKIAELPHNSTEASIV